MWNTRYRPLVSVQLCVVLLSAIFLQLYLKRAVHISVFHILLCCLSSSCDIALSAVVLVSQCCHSVTVPSLSDFIAFRWEPVIALWFDDTAITSRNCTLRCNSISILIASPTLPASGELMTDSLRIAVILSQAKPRWSHSAAEHWRTVSSPKHIIIFTVKQWSDIIDHVMELCLLTRDTHDGGLHSANDTVLALKWIGTTRSTRQVSQWLSTTMVFISNYIVWNVGQFHVNISNWGDIAGLMTLK